MSLQGGVPALQSDADRWSGRGQAAPHPPLRPCARVAGYPLCRAWSLAGCQAVRERAALRVPGRAGRTEMLPHPGPLPTGSLLGGPTGPSNTHITSKLTFPPATTAVQLLLNAPLGEKEHYHPPVPPPAIQDHQWFPKTLCPEAKPMKNPNRPPTRLCFSPLLPQSSGVLCLPVTWAPAPTLTLLD